MKQEQEIIQINDNDQMQVSREIPTIIPTGSTPFDVQFKIGVQSLNTIEEPIVKKDQLIKRITSFFWYNAPIQPGKQQFFPRRDPNYQKNQIKTLDNQLILYGSDFIKYKNIKKDYQCQKIEKIDDSHCKLFFNDFSEAWNSIKHNIKDEKMIVSKIQSENDPAPKCWFLMKPYEHLQKELKIEVRFATTDQQTIDPKKESEIQTYKVSKQIYNSQQQRKKQDFAFQMERKRQKIQIHKHKMTERLYNDYGNRNSQQWVKGKSKNPGANRQQDQRQRSRDKIPAQDSNKVPEVDFFDIQSNYSVSKINNKLNNLQLQQIDLSFHLDKAESKKSNNMPEHNWSGMGQRDSSVRFSYRKYIQEKQQEEQQAKRKQIVHVICID